MSDTSADWALNLHVECTDETALVVCRGRLVAGVNDAFYLKISPLFLVTKRVVLDLKELSRMDSMGLGALVRLYVSARSAGCTLELIRPSKQIRELLGMTHLLSVFAVIGEGGVRLG